MRVIGLTGGIASGKSIAEQCFIARGIPVIDADVVAREIMEPGQDAYNAVYAEFGAAFFRADGALDRTALRTRVFADAASLERLNAITHPVILREIRDRLARLAEYPLAVVIAPLLLETGLNALCNAVWLIICDTQTRTRRLMARDGISRTLALEMISSQLPDCEKARLSDIIIDNSGEKARTMAVIENLICEELHGLKE